ncbi:ATP-binding protein [Kitasatospora mediocidica]|uniref:ATP-binding protein n=1 Tax=Kitasatospora mediocidica TaxID=58352 RepID=UPI000AFFEA8F|nr:ATP-binding protein [Kitasatospora mediocidica]
MPQVVMPTRPAEHRVALRVGAGYDGGLGTVAAARTLADDFLGAARSLLGAPVTAAVAGSVRLVVSELVTNAAKYAPGPCLLDLELTGDDISITVWDTEPALPVPHGTDPLRVGRHGLEIVLALSRHYSAESRAGGKRVRAHLALE